jgi:hypothetical protein
MREVQTTEQLRGILIAAHNIVLIRDAINRKLCEIDNATARQNAARFMKNPHNKLWLLGLIGFPFLFLAPVMGLSEYTRNIIFMSFIIGAILLQITAGIFHKRKIKKCIKGIERDKTRMRNEVSQMEEQIHTYATFWRAEIVPPEYRNRAALEIMINAINTSRADSWKECTDIYERARMNAEMRNYHERQIRISQEAAHNAGTAADAANASASASKVSAAASVLNLLFR